MPTPMLMFDVEVEVHGLDRCRDEDVAKTVEIETGRPMSSC